MISYAFQHVKQKNRTYSVLFFVAYNKEDFSSAMRMIELESGIVDLNQIALYHRASENPGICVFPNALGALDNTMDYT